MATKLEKNVRKIIDYHGGMVVHRGILPVERLLHRHRGGVRGMRAPPCEAGMVCGHQD